MRPLTYVVVLVPVLSLLATYLVWTDGRLDRLGTRAEGAWSALDAQLVRRSAAAGELAAHCRRHGLGDPRLAALMEDAAVAAQTAGGADREGAENALSKAIRAALPSIGTLGPDQDKPVRLLAELRTAATRVGLARQFYNDAVRDLRDLRRRRIAGLLSRSRGAGASASFFEMDDAVLPVPVPGDPPQG